MGGAVLRIRSSRKWGKRGSPVENIMKVLVIAKGVVGTIYRWALSEAGVDVTHVVRREGLPGTVSLDLLDLRRGHPKNTQARYYP